MFSLSIHQNGEIFQEKCKKIFKETLIQILRNFRRQRSCAQLVGQLKEHFKAIYFETIDAVHNALRERFEQSSFIIFSNVEQLLLKSIHFFYKKAHFI